jgi:hypothetical protein
LPTAVFLVLFQIFKATTNCLHRFSSTKGNKTKYTDASFFHFRQTSNVSTEKDTNNPPDVNGARHSVGISWELVNSLSYHDRQMFAGGNSQCVCSRAKYTIIRTI